MARKKLTAAEPGTDIQIAEQTPPDIAAGEIALRAAQTPGALELALGIPAQASADELLDIGVQALNSAALHMARAGMAFRRVREQTPHGNSSGRPEESPSQDGGGLCGRSHKSFQEYLDERGVSPRRAYEAMAYATFLESLPEAQSLRLITVPHSKVLLLTKAEPEVIESLLEDGSLDGDQPMSVRDLKKALREAREKLEKESAAKAKAITAASETSAKLQKLQLTLPQRNPDAVLRDMLRELGGRVRDMQEATSALVDGIDTITRHADENGLAVDDDMGAAVVNAIRSLIGFVADLKTLRGIDAPSRFIAVVLPDIGEPS